MFREMREVGRPLTKEEGMELLAKGSWGVVSVQGDDGYPYGVPVNYALWGEKLIFHCSVKGHKADAIRKAADDGGQAKVSFVTVGKDEVLPECFNTLFTSVMVFGRAEILENPEEKRQGLQEIVKKYSADFIEEGQRYIDGSWEGVMVVAITIEHFTGKAGT